MNKHLFLSAFILFAFFIAIHGLTFAYQCDFNGDGFVDSNDIAVFSKDFGKTSGYDPQCDLNGDNDIDGSDLSIFAESLQYHTGAPAPSEYYISYKLDITRRPLAREHEGNWIVIEDLPPTEEIPLPNGPSIDPYVFSPMVGGGLSLMSTPAYDSAILGTNWTPIAHHGLIALVNEGTENLRYWESYFDSTIDPEGTECSRAFNPDEGLMLPEGISIYGQIENTGICYARHYLFEEDRLKVSVQLKSKTGEASVLRLFENIPLSYELIPNK